MITSFHHVGCVVESIDEAIADYMILQPDATISEIIDVEDQNVKVCFITIGGTTIEFVAPANKQSFLYKLFQRRPGYYHIGLYTDDIDGEIERLTASGYQQVNKFRSKAFDNRYCAFLYNKEMHLVELIEQG